MNFYINDNYIITTQMLELTQEGERDYTAVVVEQKFIICGRDKADKFISKKIASPFFVGLVAKECGSGEIYVKCEMDVREAIQCALSGK